MKRYIGHEMQCIGVEEIRLVGGMGDGMRMLLVRNGKGLEFTVSLDRCADIARLECNGVNYGFLSPCGYVAPQYYNKDEFLKSFNAGFFTTCGLEGVGAPTEYNGENLPMHGTISNKPSEWFMHEVTDNEIVIKAKVRDSVLFGRKLLLTRTYHISLSENTVKMTDEIENIGGEKTHIALLYHCNMGYPLLSETAKLNLAYNSVRPRDERAAEGLENCTLVELPQDGFKEQCYYYDMCEENGYASAEIVNEANNARMKMTWKKNTLGSFTQWKMMGTGEYVMGLEPGNLTPDGVPAAEKDGILKFLEPGEKYLTEIIFECGL